MLAAMALITSGCEDTISSKFSHKYKVRFYFEVAQSPELYNALANPGQFVTIRQKAGTGKVRIENSLSGTDYALSSIGSTDFEYGLGGLIVGTCNLLNMNNQYDIVCYDLACPNCDRADRRLTVSDDGTAQCAKCGIKYNLNGQGAIISAPSFPDDRELYALYNYPVNYNGLAVNINNY